MSNQIIFKSFMPDFSMLYNAIGENETKYGYRIRKELYDDEYVYDLSLSPDDYWYYVSDMEWCVLVEEGDDYVTIGTDESSVYKEFKLSVDEFHTICMEFVPYYIDDDGLCHNLEPEEVDWYAN